MRARGAARCFLVVALAVGSAGCGGGGGSDAAGSRVPAGVRPTAAERRPAGPIPLGEVAPVPVVPGADLSLHSATAEAGLHRVADALGAYDGSPRPLGRSADGRYLERIETHAVAVSRWPAGSDPTSAQREAARRLVRATRAAASRFADVDRAEALGYRRVDEMHYVDEAAVHDGRVLDPHRPEALMFMDMGSSSHLVGVMFLVGGRDRGPQIGGPLTTWHYHLFGSAVCMVGGGFPTALADAAGHCADGTPETRSPEMLHVWLGVGGRQVFSPYMDTVPMAHTRTG